LFVNNVKFAKRLEKTKSQLPDVNQFRDNEKYRQQIKTRLSIMNSKVSLKTVKGNLGYYCENAAYKERIPKVRSNKSLSPLRESNGHMPKEIRIIQE